MLTPIYKALKTIIMAKLALTAARQWVPSAAKLPTTTESTTLYSCWNKLPSIIGREKRMIFLVIGPWVRSLRSAAF